MAKVNAHFFYLVLILMFHSWDSYGQLCDISLNGRVTDHHENHVLEYSLFDKFDHH